MVSERKKERESNESESPKLAEMQENLRVRKETLRVAFEEINILREDLLREGESMDKNMSHVMSPESTEEIRTLEQQELAFWRGSASKRLAGWTRDGSVEEIAGWVLEAQRLNREVEAKKRKLKEAIEKESGKDARMGDDSMDVLDGSLSSQGCKHGYSKQYPSGNGLWKRKNSGLSSAVTDRVSLKVLSWNVAGLSEDSTDIFLSQISMLTDWDVVLLQECFRKLDGVNVGAHELFTPCELLGGLRCPAVIMHQR